MNNKLKSLLAVLFILGVIVAAFIISNMNNDPYFKKVSINDISFENSKVLKMDKKRKEKLYSNIIDYLNSKKYNNYRTITFKEVDTVGEIYIYFYLDNEFRTLIECVYNEDVLNCKWMGDNLSDDTKSKVTNKTYLQIMNPKKYEKNKELNEYLDEAEKRPSDDSGDISNIAPEASE